MKYLVAKCANIYLVSRTSVMGGSPCDEAFEVEILADTVVLRRWAVYITNIMDFVDTHGECVLSRDEYGFANIEIYDTCRE